MPRKGAADSLRATVYFGEIALIDEDTRVATITAASIFLLWTYLLGLPRGRREEFQTYKGRAGRSPKFIDGTADDDGTNECTEKYGDPSASNHVASSGAVDRTSELTQKCAEPYASNHVVSNAAEYSTDYSRDL